MCGIAGFLDAQGSIEILRAMMDKIRHRGPDGDGVYQDGVCSLGHLRLRIIDLSDRARQPMAAQDGSAVVTFNGEVYNFRTLRDELSENYAFRSASDTEVMLAGYGEWGDGVWRRLNGMFAAAIWDVRQRRLVLARDRLGKKPLFYYWNRDTVVFASELKSVLAHPRVSRALDEQALVSFFAFGYVPTPRTIFRDIYKVPQGSTVSFVDGKRTIDRYWELPCEEVDVGEDDALDELQHVLVDAVRIRLESDVPLGFFLSGGVDSTLITAIGHQLTGAAHSFTVGFKDPRFNEAPQAERIARHIGTKHETLYPPEEQLLRFLDGAATYFDEPFGDSSLIPTAFLATATKQRVTVALSGDGGDELFCGYQKYLNLHQLRPFMRLPGSVRELLARTLERIPTNTTRKVGDALHACDVEQLTRWFVSIWKPHELEALFSGERLDWSNTELARTLHRFDHRDVLTRLMAADVSSYLCDDILQKVDRASMAVALEVRSPLLDYRVVELAMRLPLHLKFRQGEQKYLLRRLLERYVPARLWNRPKRGFMAPVATWYRGSRKTHIAGAIEALGRHFADTLSASTMRTFLERHLTGRYDYSQKLFTLDALDGWTKEYLS